MFYELNLFFIFVRLETMDIVNVIYVRHGKLITMDLYGVGYILVTWSSCLKIYVYPLVLWFFLFYLVVMWSDKVFMLDG